MSDYAESRRTGHHRLGRRARERSEGEDRRSRRRAGQRLRRRPRQRRDRLELADRSVRHDDPRPHRSARRSPSCASEAGIKPDDTVIFYGDMNNWFAAWALWQFKYHGHKDVQPDERRAEEVGSWKAGRGRPTSRRSPRANYPAPSSDESIRSYRDEVLKARRRARTSTWSTCARRMSSPAKILAPEALIGKEGASAAGTSPARRTSPGPRPSTKTARSRSADELQEALRRSPASISPSRRSPTAASASARATRGSS